MRADTGIILEIAGIAMTFPIIGDKDRKIAFLYDMVPLPLPQSSQHTTNNHSLTTKIQPTSTRAESPSQSAQSSSSTRRKLSALSSLTPLQQVAIQQNFFEWSTHSKRPISTRLPRLSTGTPEKMWLFIRVWRLMRPKISSPNYVLWSRIWDIRLCRRRL